MDGYSVAVATYLLIVMLAGLIERHLARKGRNEKS